MTMPNNTGPMTKDNMVELKPCPFCGGEAKFTRDHNAIGCTNCWAEGPVTTPEGIAGEWNTRATMHGSDSGVTEAMLDAGEAAYDKVGEGYNAHRRALGKAFLAMSSASAPDSGALREALVEARGSLESANIVLEGVTGYRSIAIDTNIERIDAALNLSSETGE